MTDEDIVDALEQREERLTGWELDLVESLREGLDSGLALTAGQRDKAEEILRRLET